MQLNINKHTILVLIMNVQWPVR